jgi:DNA (cytosine-5)-methyltransferase 1
MKSQKQVVSIPKVIAADLFCGAGGLTYGLESVGIDVRIGIDVDPACEFPYTANSKARFLRKSVEAVHADELESALGNDGIRLLAGCAPCQTFSTYNQKAGPLDSRWWLLTQFSRIVEEMSPDLVTMENVPGLRDRMVFKDFIHTLEELGYWVTHEILDCSDYGVPQHRQRLVLLASKLGKIALLSPKNIGWRVVSKTVRDAIGGMPPLKAGAKDGNDGLHRCSSLSQINTARIHASRPGGTWRDWEDELVAVCHRKESGKTYPSVYGRMSWDQPSPTITTQFFGFGNGRFGHPEQDRAISLREGAILQSFPRGYRFMPTDEPIPFKTVGRLIGNAVPPKLGEAIGLSILEHVASWSRTRGRLICDG